MNAAQVLPMLLCHRYEWSYRYVYNYRVHTMKTGIMAAHKFYSIFNLGICSCSSVRQVFFLSQRIGLQLGRLIRFPFNFC